MTAYFMKSFIEYVHGIPVVMDANTTLNEKYEVMMNKTLLRGSMPKIEYFGVGIGGVGSPKTAYHHGLDGDLFEPIPLIARDLINDLPTEERSKYRMRVEKTIDGVDYVMYYLRAIDDDVEKIAIKKLEKSEDEPSRSKVTPLDLNTAELLNPVARENDELDMSTSKFYLLESGLSFSFTETEKAELISAYRLVKGTTDTPEISEICMYSGMDSYEEGEVEAYAVRSAYFYSMPYELRAFPSEPGTFQRYINIAGSRLYK